MGAVGRCVLVAGVVGVAVVEGCVPHGGFAFEVARCSGPSESPDGEGLLQGGFRLSAAEQIVVDTPSPETARAHLRHYASEEHMAGTAGDLRMAEFTQEKMRSFGLEDSKIHTLKPLLNYPLSRSLELLDEDGSVQWEVPMSEKELEMDPTSHTLWRNMSFLGYGASGDVTGPLVYANYGSPADFEYLEKIGVDVKGKIVIARYGQSFRGLKVMNAERRGALGVLIYSDPADDGYAVGEVYPDGPWRPESSIQRGSISFSTLCEGDPGRANVEEICGFKTEQLMPTIPALALSYGDATPLLKTLGGQAVPESWRGGLVDRITYTTGPSTQTVRLIVNNTFVRTPIWNVITTIQGEKDEPVVVGNHRDAWVFGAADPNSGSTVLLETARALGKLVQTGWKPKRTIILASWSGEEYNLIGSTGWSEEFADTLLKDAVAYINTDVGVSGDTLGTSGSPSLGRAIGRALTKVTDPVSGKPLDQVWNHKLTTLGDGSDYAAFVTRLGIPALDFLFGPSNGHPYGTYHSIYDSYAWIEKTVDPEYELHTTLAKVLGLVVLDFADSDVVPVQPNDLAQALGSYKSEVQAMEQSLSYKSLTAAIAHFRRAADTFEETKRTKPVGCVNDRLIHMERWFLDNDGLPDRKYFRSVLQAPGYYLGYAAEVFPGIQHAISEGHLDVAQELIQKTAAIVESAARKLAAPCASSSFAEEM
mmetsp:Transcript_585/g.845  ORF Transcript_585/g.845 Transcript_585/m.845 type:complete len:705 (+) Transcript_585:31-2145(+)